MDRRCQHSLGSPPPLRPKRAAQTAAQGFAPADSPTTTANQKKGDTSNEVKKGTFLKRLDTIDSPGLPLLLKSTTMMPLDARPGVLSRELFYQKLKLFFLAVSRATS